MASRWRARSAQLAALTLLGGCQPAHSDADDRAPPVAAAAPANEPQSQVMTCSHPVRRDDTSATLQARFGDDARSETLGGPEGSEFPGLALWPDDPTRRVEVFFAEDGPARVSSVRLGDHARWQVAALAIGDSLKRVNEVNRRPFTFLGFGWDYGGYASDWSDGRLAALPGGCTLSLRLDAFAPTNGSLAISGDVEVRSDVVGLDAADIRVAELSLGFDGE